MRSFSNAPFTAVVVTFLGRMKFVIRRACSTLLIPALLLTAGIAAGQPNGAGLTAPGPSGFLTGGPTRTVFEYTPFGLQQLLLTTTGGPVTLSATKTGWWDETGSHSSGNPNYIAGVCGASVCFGGGANYHDFFVFDLSSITPPPSLLPEGATITPTITAASLSIGNPASPPGFFSPNPTETYQVFDVSTSIATLSASGAGRVDIFNDLGSGTMYASRTVSSADNGTQVIIPFNAAGVAALNAAIGGSIAVGGAVLLGPSCPDHTVHGHITTTPPDAHDGDSHAHHAQHGHHLLPGVVCLAPGHHVTVNGHILGLTPESADALIPSALNREPDFVAALNQDNATGPAQRGTVVQLFGSAKGLFLDLADLRPALEFTPSASGSPLYYTERPPEVEIGGVKAEVLFSGLAPGLKGVWQINVRIPEGVASGKVPVTISYDGETLQSIDLAVE